MGDLGRTVGANQKQIRTERGLSLDALAKLSGVSRSNLAQIERGKANPSIATVWQIASALKVGFSELVTVSDAETHVVGVRDAEPSTNEDGAYRVYCIFAFDPALGFELYDAELDEGGALSSAPHPGGTIETVTVIAGEITLDAGGETFVLGPDTAIRFAADRPHAYSNTGTGTARFSMIVAYSRKG